jgi:hypothetical protein
MPFPSVKHQFKPGGVTPNRGGIAKTNGRAARKKARRILAEKAVAATLETYGQPPPQFEGTALQLLQATYKDMTLPLEIRLAAANSAMRMEEAEEPQDPPITREQRRGRIREMILASDLQVIPEPAVICLPDQTTEKVTIEGEPAVDLAAVAEELRKERNTLRMQVEGNALRKEIARLEKLDRERKAEKRQEWQEESLRRLDEKVRQQRW